MGKMKIPAMKSIFKKARREEEQCTASQDDVSSEESDTHNARPHHDDEHVIYFPLFSTTAVPNEYFRELERHTSEESLWLEVLTQDPEQILPLGKEFAGRACPNASPFRQFTIAQLYDYFKTNLRPADDVSLVNGQFSYFTFIVVDEACVEAEPWECILCSDAPDFGEAEGEIQLKQLRMEFEDAIRHLPALEQLCITPDEIEDRDMSLTFEVMPPAGLLFTHKEGNYGFGTMEQARKDRRRILNIIEEALKEEARQARKHKTEIVTNTSGTNGSENPGQNEIVKIRKRHDKKTNEDTEKGFLEAQKAVTGEIVDSDTSRRDEGRNTHNRKAAPETNVDGDTSKEDITISVFAKPEYIRCAELHRQVRLIVRKMGDPSCTASFTDNLSDDVQKEIDDYKAMMARRPTRPVYSLYRPVYGPLVEGQETPCIVSKTQRSKQSGEITK